MPSPDLSAKTLVMIVGPSATGKSTLMNEVIKRDQRFNRVRSFTTRSPRSNDEPGHYIYMSLAELQEKEAAGEILTDIVFPTTGHHYGTVEESYGNGFNLLDTLAHSVEEYRNLPFARTITISLTTNPDTWQQWLEKRFPNRGSDMKLRLEEAVLSIEWSLSQTHDHLWLVNEPDNVEATADRLIALVLGDVEHVAQPPQAKRLHERAKLLLSYE